MLDGTLFGFSYKLFSFKYVLVLLAVAIELVRTTNAVVFPTGELLLKTFDIKVKVVGGGYTGQAGAIRLGIARALIDCNAEQKTTLKRAKLTTRDSRVKERKKYGKYGARRSPQFTKR